MGRRVAAVLLALLLAGCTRVVTDARPQAESPVAPITAGQAADLLSEHVQKGSDGNLFATVEPEECAALAREVDPPFIFSATPAAHDGGHWNATGGAAPSIEEMVGVYRTDFDAKAAVEEVTRTLGACHTAELVVTALEGEVIHAHLQPAPDSGSPHIALWSFTAEQWACDNAFVAAHNAAIEITACARTNGYDVLSLAKEALMRIDTLANRTA
jgi:hypothetical protein